MKTSALCGLLVAAVSVLLISVGGPVLAEDAPASDEKKIEARMARLESGLADLIKTVRVLEVRLKTDNALILQMNRLRWEFQYEIVEAVEELRLKVLGEDVLPIGMTAAEYQAILDRAKKQAEGKDK